MDKIKAITIADDEAYLRQVSEVVDFNDDNLSMYIDILDRYCKENDVFAMASIQLGIPKRIIYLKNTNLEIIEKMQRDNANFEEENFNESRILINPVIVLSEGLTDYWEACASCLDNFGHVKRPYRIILEYYDINGNKKNEIFEGFESTVLSHEMDHLDGILHMDIADELVQMTKEERKLFRQTHGYNIVFKDGKYEDLVKTT